MQILIKSIEPNIIDVSTVGNSQYEFTISSYTVKYMVNANCNIIEGTHKFQGAYIFDSIEIIKQITKELKEAFK